METDIIALFQGKSHKYIELCIIKEYLLEQKIKLIEEQKPYGSYGESVKIPSHHQNILFRIFQDRINQVDAMLKNVLHEIKELEK